jgi:hypothetical protein
MKVVKAFIVVLCIFAPFIMLGFAIAHSQNPLHLLYGFVGMDSIWFIFLGLMMVGLYYLLAVYVEEENEIELDFAELDKDHDGYIGRQDASVWSALAKVFDKFDADHDGKLSRMEFERFEHSLAR